MKTVQELHHELRAAINSAIDDAHDARKKAQTDPGERLHWTRVEEYSLGKMVAFTAVYSWMMASNSDGRTLYGYLKDEQEKVLDNVE